MAIALCVAHVLVQTSVTTNGPQKTMMNTMLKTIEAMMKQPIAQIQVLHREPSVHLAPVKVQVKEWSRTLFLPIQRNRQQAMRRTSSDRAGDNGGGGARGTGEPT